MQVKSLFIYNICLITLQLFSQSKLNPNHDKIATAFENYFRLDRENIHLHLNKNTYQTNEESDLKVMTLGMTDWIPFIKRMKMALFHFSIPNLNQKSVYFIVEGISPDGQLVSDSVFVDIP